MSRATLRNLLMLFPQALHGLAMLYAKVVSQITRRDFNMLVLEKLGQEISERRQVVHHVDGVGKSLSLTIFTPNRICKMRADTFETKEPEILRWIDRRGGGGTFWDIGANIGLYSLYYAQTKPGRVVAFEPSVFNLRQLAKNISDNGLSQKIDIAPFALSDRAGFQSFRTSSELEGGALNAFGVNYGSDGNALNSLLEYRTFGITADQLIEQSLVSGVPAMIKIDVDGIEHLILRGAMRVLGDEACRSVYVEVNDGFAEQSNSVSEILTACGFALSERHDDLVTNNQIWVKN